MLEVDLDRIDGRVAANALRSEMVHVSEGQASIELPRAEDHEIDLYFPAPHGVVENRWIEQARDVLGELAEMDNAVQRSCAEECAKSGLHSRNFESWLAYTTLVNADAVVLGYFGAVVNTQWEEDFVRVEGKWILAEKMSPSPPGRRRSTRKDTCHRRPQGE